jgi:regulator of protease activity HflC (stomatin/prohibitin superfamily)
MEPSSKRHSSAGSTALWEPQPGEDGSGKGPPGSASGGGVRERDGAGDEIESSYRSAILRSGAAAGRYLAWTIGIALATAFLAIFLSPDVFVIIGPGDVGVLYRPLQGGTQTDAVLGEGLKLIAPWDTLYIYTIRVQEAKHEIEVLTKEGLGVKLHLSVRYHPEPEMVGMLHKLVGPKYKERIVLPEVESALRVIMGGFTMHQVYGSERGLVQKVINESLEGVSQKFVRIDDLILRHVELPPEVRKSIEEKMRDKELAEAHVYKLEREQLEARRKEVEAEGLKRYNEVLDSSITPNLLRWRGIEATRELAQSNNTKTIIVGNRGSDMPLMLGGEK